MHYFLTHNGYIIIAAVVIALLAFAAVFLGEKNEAERDINDERCDFTCSGCPNVSIYTKRTVKGCIARPSGFCYFTSIVFWLGLRSLYVSVKSREWVNRGFMHGPFLPIYGSGAIVILLSTIGVRENSGWFISSA